MARRTTPKKSDQSVTTGSETGQGQPEPGDVEPLSQFVCDRVKQLRKQKGWTLEQLSLHSNVSRSMLSQVERGNANPTLVVAFRIAQAFGVSLADLVEGASANEPIEVVRGNDTTALFRNDSVCRIRTLSPLNLEKDVEFYEVILLPKQTLRSAGHFAGTREFLTVSSGKVRIQSAGQIVELKKGDSAQYTADVEHSIENLGRSNAVLFLVDIYSRG
ncbi:MAG: XRE family transcriptional regulator [Planctomycetota bacterium]